MSDLRRRAEARLEESGGRRSGGWDPDLRSLLHELQVHEVELELQYEELLKAHAEADRARQGYEDLYENAPVGYLTLDENGVVRQVNAAMADSHGAGPATLTGQPFLRYVVPAFQAELVQLCNAARADPGHRVTGRIDVRRESGRTFPGQAEARSPDGTTVLMVIVDIGERLQAEEALREQADRLKRSNEDLERYAYVSSHDLQEPIRSIVSFSQLLERRYKGKLDREADEYIDFIVAGGLQMQALIKDLLQFSRVTTLGSRPVRTESGAVLERALRDLRPAIEASGATVEHGRMPEVLADELQLEQVFTNLVANAVKFRREGVPLRIVVSAEREGDWTRFAVADNGIGIAPEYFDRIFVIFQRLHTRDRYEGTGIGLPLVKRIVEQHGGRVWVRSESGLGSVFNFTLPAA